MMIIFVLLPKKLIFVWCLHFKYMILNVCVTRSYGHNGEFGSFLTSSNLIVVEVSETFYDPAALQKIDATLGRNNKKYGSL